jgi:hypothetical protein
VHRGYEGSRPVRAMVSSILPGSAGSKVATRAYISASSDRLAGSLPGRNVGVKDVVLIVDA